MNFVIDANRKWPTILNSDIFWFQSYPKGVYDKANMVVDRWMYAVWVAATNFSLTPINVTPLLLDIWPVNINGYNQTINLAKAFWESATNPSGNNWLSFVWWSVATSTIYAPATYTWSWISRFVSNESFKSWQAVGWRILLHPLVTLWLESGFANRTQFSVQITNLQLTAKLIDTSWVMVTIWTTTNVANWESSWLIFRALQNKEWLLPIIDESFTPIIANDWDRLIIEIDMTCEVTYTAVLAWGSSAWNHLLWAWLELWYAWNDKPISHKQSFRPIQVSVA